MDDNLPEGDINDAIQKFDSDFELTGYQDTVDYDPDQNPDDDNKRLLKIKLAAPSQRRLAATAVRSVLIKDRPSHPGNFVAASF